MTKKIVWRLKESPTTDKLSQLVKDGILTKEEAREILFSNEEMGERDADSLKEEIKFLRELVQKLSSSRSEIITTIKEIEVPIYRRYPWYIPYVTWYNASVNNASSSGNYDTSTSGTYTDSIGTSHSDFTSINTY